MKIVDRKLKESISQLLTKYPIVALTGPRQSGKTTLLKNILPNYKYVSLENIDERKFAIEDPNGFLMKYNSKIIFDEIQRVPELFSYLQTFVDEKNEMGQFILSGSQNFHLLKSITQSLAGRVALLKLMPFDIKELKVAKLLTNNWTELILKGFYPAIYSRNIRPDIFYSNYIQTYINRDLSDLSNIHNIRLFKNFIRLCAARVGQLLNLNNLAKDCGITQPTAKSWLSILESSYIVFLLPAHFENFNKRIIKSPKLYFYDTGLVSFLLGLRKKDDLSDQVLLGSLFENLIVGEIFKQNYHQNLMKEYWFWRDSKGHEIDLITEKGRAFDIFEIKSTKTILPKLFKGIDYFDKISGERIDKKYLIYGGNESYERTKYSILSWKDSLV